MLIRHKNKCFFLYNKQNRLNILISLKYSIGFACVIASIHQTCIMF